MNKLTQKLSRALFKGKVFCTKHSAEICIGVAAVTSVTAVVTAIKATHDIQDDLQMHKNNIQGIKDCYDKENETFLYDELVNEETMDIQTTEYTGEEAKKVYRKSITGEYARTSLTIAKYYAIPVALEITSVVTMLTSNKISRKKNASLTASLTAVQAMYDKYRQNVVEKYGEEEDFNLAHGISKEVAKEGKKKEEVNVVDKNKIVDPFTALFAEGNSYWSPSMGQNRDTLELRQSYWNDKFIRDGYVFVNDILKDLDLEEYCTELGQYYGWIYNEDHPAISFHLYNAFESRKIAFNQGAEPNIWITLIPDGYIADKVWPKKVA